MARDFTTLLQNNNLKITAPRISVLELIASKDSATSQPYLEKHINKDVDRVTLYRILKAFEEKGIVHKIIDSQGTANYALCSSHCEAGHHHDDHVHFSCTNCHEIYCLEEFHIPEMKLPKSYLVESANMLLSGTCANCKGGVD